jgi:hypothetical protein
VTRVAVVGNGAVSSDESSLVDASDLVVRFNWPATWAGNSGTPFDIWVIANGRAGRTFAVKRTFVDAPFKHLPRQIWFPRALGLHNNLPLHPAYGGALGVDAETEDVGNEILHANSLRQPCVRFDANFYSSCIRQLYGDDHSSRYILMPSAGFMATMYVLQNIPFSKLILVGFGFRGWAGHPWDLERSRIQSLEHEGALCLIPS